MSPYHRISGYFVSNRKLSTLLLFALFFWGVLSFILTPKQYNPDIVAPAFLIRVEAPGMTSEEVYELVTKPLENVVHEIPGVEDIYSQSQQGGVSYVTVRFYVGEDLEKSMITLRQKISTNLDLKPVGAKEPVIKAIDPEDLPMMTVALVSEKYSPVQLRRIAYFLKDELKMVSGTSIIEVVGGRKREFQINLDPERMLSSKTDLHEIDQALDKTSVLKDLGPMKTEDWYYPVELGSTVNSLPEIEDLVIASNVSVGLKTREVAEVQESSEERTSVANLTLKDKTVQDAVFLSIAKKKGENIVPLAKQLRSEIKDLSREPFLKDVQILILRDEGEVAGDEIGRLTWSLMQAILIVFAVLFLFLNVRAAMIVALSVPLTLLAVFGVGLLAGYTINRITLFALILSLGLLVDSATVVIENIVRNKKMSPQEPVEPMIARSVSEVGTGLFLSTLTTVLAFIPMAFVTGMMGPYMGPIPFFVPAALTIALIFAYTLNPWLASVMCHRGQTIQNEPKLNFFAGFQKRFMVFYENLMESLLSDSKKRLRLMGVGVILILIVSLFPVVGLVRFRMLPKADRNQVYIYLDLDRGTSLERTDKIAKGLAENLRKEKNVTSVQSFVGMPPILDFNGMFKDASSRSGTHQATLRVNLLHHTKRKKKSEALAVNYRSRIGDCLKDTPGAKFQIIEDPPGPPVQSTFMLKVKGTNPELLREVSLDLEEKLGTVKGLKDLDTTNLEPLDKYRISVNREKAAQAQVGTTDLARVLTVLYSGVKIGVYHDDRNQEQEYIVLKFPRYLRNSIKDLEQIHVTNALGNQVPVSKFLYIEKVPAEEIFLGDNRRQAVYISGEMEQRSVTYAAIDALKILYDYRLPTGDGERENFSLFGANYKTVGGEKIQIELGGEWELTLEVFRDLGIAMGVAIFLIYFVMVVQFRSYQIPLFILGTIPLSLVGVMPGFALLYFIGGVYFSATSMIGVIALSGIVVNNAIILMEYILQKSEAGRPFKKEVIIDACKTRLRPILLTSATTVLGTLMIASDPVWAGLAWSIVFGLSLSSVLTLVFFPTLVYHFQKA